MLVLQSDRMYYEYEIRNSHGNSYSASSKYPSPKHSYVHTCTHIHIHTHPHTRMHTRLPPPPPPLTHADFQYLERFVCSAYDIQCRFNTNDINKLRYLLFLKLCENSLRRLPPTRCPTSPHIPCSLCCWLDMGKNSKT